MHYRTGVLFVIMNNGRYAIMDQLGQRQGFSRLPWPKLDHIDIAQLGAAFGAEVAKVASHGELTTVLDRVVPGLAALDHPVLLDVTIETSENLAL